ncbi:MAG: hypothetical protein KIG50_06270 [Lachnospiraceae bacterium]|nr:hypothetical protein [Lachnospiraceae bacterium]
MEDKKIKLLEQEVEYKKGLKWYKLPYSDIKQAYLRVEEVNGKLCCGVANFDMFFLVIKTKEEKQIKLEASSKEIVKEMLEFLQEKNPEIEIGFKK